LKVYLVCLKVVEVLFGLKFGSFEVVVDGKKKRSAWRGRGGVYKDPSPL
jgi:hypothetical protein